MDDCGACREEMEEPRAAPPGAARDVSRDLPASGSARGTPDTRKTSPSLQLLPPLSFAPLCPSSPNIWGATPRPPHPGRGQLLTLSAWPLLLSQDYIPRVNVLLPLEALAVVAERGLVLLALADPVPAALGLLDLGAAAELAGHDLEAGVAGGLEALPALHAVLVRAVVDDGLEGLLLDRLHVDLVALGRCVEQVGIFDQAQLPIERGG